MNHQSDALPSLVLVEWLDSRSPEPGWRFIEDGDMPRVCECVSVGYLVKDGENEKILAQSLGDVSGGQMQANGLMAIPSRAVVAMRPLTSS